MQILGGGGGGEEGGGGERGRGGGGGGEGEGEGRGRGEEYNDQNSIIKRKNLIFACTMSTDKMLIGTSLACWRL